MGTARPLSMEFRQNGRDWELLRATVLEESRAARGGFQAGISTGRFLTHAEYSGCPYCGSKGILRCACGKVTCWDGERRTVVCPWCRTPGEVSGVIESLDTVGDT